MNRRTLIKLTGVVAAGQVLHSVSATRPLESAPGSTAARFTIPEPGTYRISGTVRLQAPTVEISGIATTQQITWSSPQQPLSSFMSFERFDRAGIAPNIRVRGGQIESLTVVRVDPLEMS